MVKWQQNPLKVAEHVKVCGHKEEESEAVRLKDKNFYSEFKWRQNAKSASPAKPPQSQHETAFTAHSTFVCDAFHSIFLNIYQDKSRPGLDFIHVEFMKIGRSSPEPAFKEEMWRLMFKFTLQSISIYPNGRVRSCIWQSLLSKGTYNSFNVYV